MMAIKVDDGINSVNENFILIRKTNSFNKQALERVIDSNNQKIIEFYQQHFNDYYWYVFKEFMK